GVSAVYTSRDRKSRSTWISRAVSCRGCARLHSGAGKRDQVISLAADERQFQNPRVLGNLADAGGSGFHHGGIGLNLDRLADLANLQNDVDCWIGVDLQHNSALREGTESRQSRFQAVRTDRQVRQNV